MQDSDIYLQGTYRNGVYEQVHPAQTLQKLLDKAKNLKANDERLADLANRAAVLAKSLNDTSNWVESKLILANYYLLNKKYSNVIATLEPLADEALDIPDMLEARLLFCLVRACRPLGEITKLLHYGTKALKLYEQTGDVQKQIRLHSDLGDACGRFSAYHEGLEHHLKELELLRSQGENLAVPYGGIGWIYYLLEDFDKSLTYLYEGLDRARQEKNERMIAICLGNLGSVYERLQDYEKALSFNEQSIDVDLAFSNHGHAMISYGNMGEIYCNMGDLPNSIKYFEKALAQLKLTPNQAFEAWVYIQMGEAFLEMNDPRAETCLLDGLKKQTEVGSQEGAEEAHQHLSRLYECQGNATKALEHYKTYTKLYIQRLKDVTEKRTKALSIQFEVDHLQQEQEIYHLKNVELARAVEQLEELSVRDGLTGLYNRRYLDTHLRNVFLEAQENKDALTVLISDIDNFKAVNDNLSHATGDDVLKTVAQIFNDNTWGADIVARYGGEEFVIVFKNTPLDEALFVAEKLRLKIEKYPWCNIHKDLAVTVSMGLCDEIKLEDQEKMLSVADSNLYKAKRTGKNKIVS